MSQQTITNGPSNNGENGGYKSELLNQDPPKPPPTYDNTGTTRPPLNRLDSRSNFIRSPFPNNQPPPAGGGAVGPAQVRPLQQGRPPGAQFLQRGPPSNFGVAPQGRPQPSAIPAGAQPYPSSPQTYSYNQGQTPIQGQLRPNFRPPFPRPPLQPNQRPQIFQQRSVPSFGGTRPFLPEDTLLRSQTLDSSDLDTVRNADQSRSPMEPRSPSVNSNRGFNVSPNPNINMKRQGSTDSLSHGSAHGSFENLNKDIPSRPGSRMMDKILENGGQDLEQRRINQEEASTVQQKSPEPNAQQRGINEQEIPTAQRNSPEPNAHQQHKINPGEIQTEPQKTPEPIRTETPEMVRNKSENLNEGKSAEEYGKEKIKNVEKAAEPLKEKKVEEDRKKNMELKFVSSIKKEGDNDSGVDESTQGNDRSSNGDARSLRKGSKQRVSSTTPTARSSSRGSKTPSLRSPDSTATTPGSTSERKKLPMNKIQVGSAPSPNLKVVKSKIGSLQNASYKPGGGNVKIETKKIEIKATPRIEAKNEKYAPKGGEKKIVQQKLQWNATSKIGSLENATYKPKGGEKKIESVKLEWKAQSKIGSKDNIKHQPGGGDIKIENRKLEIHAQSKIGSMDNVKHRPGGGEKKIFDDKDYLKQQKSGISSMEHSLSGSQDYIEVPKRVSISEEIRTYSESLRSPMSNKNNSLLHSMIEEDVTFRRSASARYLSRNSARSSARNSSGEFSRKGSVRMKKKTVEDSARPKWRM